MAHPAPRSTIAALSAAVFVLAPMLPAVAQVIEVPAVAVGPDTGVGWYSQYGVLSVGAGADGGFATSWVEAHTSSAGRTNRWALVTEAFTELATSRRPSERLESPDVIAGTTIVGFSSGYAVGFHGGESPTDLHLHSQFLALDGAPLTRADVSEMRVDPSNAPVVASMSTGSVFVWVRRPGNVVTASLWNTLGQPRSGPIDVAVDPAVRLDGAGTSDGGFVVAFEGDAFPRLRFFDANGVARGAVLEPGVPGRLARAAASPAGDVVALGLFREGPANTTELWVQRLDSSGALLGAATLVYTAQLIQPDMAFDRNGNLYVVWSEGLTVARARVFDRDGVPVGPAVEIAAPVHNGIRTARLADSSRFVNVWQASNRHYANVVSLCTPGTAICGDGVFDAFCERCDDGAGNSDTSPDACRTTCERPVCGDDVTDGGEECDDGNATACDGCSACRLDVGLGCGDGIAIPACGETCDDGNTVVGDGCAPDCRLERAPGGGPAPTDCYTAWSIDNPANEPLLDKTGAIRRAQDCVDDDPRCDFDGGTPGGCTFHVRVCVNNTDLAACMPGTRLAGWTLRAPSASRAEHDAVAAAQRDALLAAVLPNVVGPPDRDLCSPIAAVIVPLRPGGHTAKVAFKSDAALYTGARDIDKLRLTCLPAAP